MTIEHAVLLSLSLYGGCAHKEMDTDGPGHSALNPSVLDLALDWMEGEFADLEDRIICTQ